MLCLIEEGMIIVCNIEVWEMMIVFMDLVGFINLVFYLSVEEMVFYFNGYFEIVLEVIVEWDGIIDKFFGDGVMVFWGVLFD